MHAPIETLSMKDLESMSALLQAFITEEFSA
jgi:putative aminopeptidase FrvX